MANTGLGAIAKGRTLRYGAFRNSGTFVSVEPRGKLRELLVRHCSALSSVLCPPERFAGQGLPATWLAMEKPRPSRDGAPAGKLAA